MTPPVAARSTGRWLLPLVADLVCVLAFSFGGKSSHEAGDSDWVVLAIVWPYALATLLAHAWLVRTGRRTDRAWPEGARVLGVTFVLGMVLRAIAGRGIAIGFLVVALAFLTITMLGWRVILRLVLTRPWRRSGHVTQRDRA